MVLLSLNLVKQAFLGLVVNLHSLPFFRDKNIKEMSHNTLVVQKKQLLNPHQL